MEKDPVRRAPLYGVIALGVGLALAPVFFRMFTRAPLGGQMIQEFSPFMSAGTVSRFEGHIGRIDASDREIRDKLRPQITRLSGIEEGEFADRFARVNELEEGWPTIEADMGEMLAVMERSLDNFAAVDALPPFALFPWFFVLPGLLTAGVGLVTLRRDRRAKTTKTPLAVLAFLGVGLIGAPFVFQMFTRAPLGAEMLEDFGPLMTEENVARVQHSFLVIGAAEGEVRNRLRPFAQTTLRIGADEWTDRFPAIESFTSNWPQIAAEMAPMVGAMSDNLDNFAAIDALPPFWLFPWFFVGPGALVVTLAVMSARPVRREATRSSVLAASKEV
jgi:hypothetical protein